MPTNRARRGFGFSVARIAGIEIRVDLSLAIVFALITFSLGKGVFPAWHPDWGAFTTWSTALAAAFAFFVSILLHELSHALVGRAHGIPINAITLFVFGGVAELEREPHTWRAELLMAIAGPIASLALGSVFLMLGSAFAGPVDLDGGEQAFAALNPLATLLVWLGPVNIILAIFNLVPGFPLDGGRVLRAVLWGITGDLVRATQWASMLGQGFAWFLIMIGVGMMLGLRVPLLGGGAVTGMWLAFIGWFLNNAALTSYRQLLVREALEDVPVSRIMRRRWSAVPPEMPLEVLVDEHLMQGDERGFAVVRGGDLLGLVCLEDIRRIPRHAWSSTSVGDVMTPTDQLATIDIDADAAEALQSLSQSSVNQLPVFEHGAFVGLITREDILKWLSFHRSDTLA